MEDHVSERTPNFNLSTLGPGEHLSDDGYKYTKADRELIDRLLMVGARDHHHTGVTTPTDAPDTGPNLDLGTGGSIPAGTRVFYKYSWVDINGFETMPSPETYIDTPAQIVAPASPTASFDNVGGSLLAGQYWYVVSAYASWITQETLGATPVAINIPVATNTNRITLSLPTLPSGATGFNIYRRKPGGNQYYYVGSQSGSGDWVDNGLPDDCNRTVPAVNNTNSMNSITVTLPMSIPDGMTWKLFRSYVNGTWDRSLLHWVVEETFEGSGIITDQLIDIGEGTSEGQPAETNQGVGSPTKIELTDAAEVQGRLPLGTISAFPTEINFNYPGALIVVEGTGVWVCPFPQATIVSVVAATGRGKQPTGSNVVVDVNRARGATPVYTTIFTDQTTRPIITPWSPVSAFKIPQVTELLMGDFITVDIDNIDSAAHAEDLTVIVHLLVYGWTDLTSHEWA